MTHFVWLGGLFRNKQSVCVCLCACGYMFIDNLSVHSFTCAPLSNVSYWPPVMTPLCSSSTSQMVISLSGMPVTGTPLQLCVNTDPAVWSVINCGIISVAHIRGKHLERHSVQLWGRSQEPQTRFPTHASILGLWNTSRCFQSNHFWSFGEGGEMAYEMLIKQITYIRADMSLENVWGLNKVKSGTGL